MSDQSNLFKPIKLGSIELGHRVAMAPLTRHRATGNQPQDILVTYYGQRASRPGTFLITEGTFISEKASGYPNAPGIYNQEQIKGWSKVFDDIHSKKSYVFVQLWALGRSANKAVLDAKGLPYVSASNIAENVVSQDSPKPRALTVAEIKDYVRTYVQAAKNALEAGADGVEIHNANGFLPDQFLHENSNNRTDNYGGSIENRARFTLEIVDALIAAIGTDKVGLRLSPWNVFGDMDPGISPIPQFSYVLAELEKRGREGKRLAYVHVVEPRWIIKKHVNDVQPSAGSNEFVGVIWKGTLIRSGGYSLELAKRDADERDNVLIAMGRYFISTPDLVDRWEKGIPVNKYNRDTFYTSGPEGYIDYPFAEKI